jgi:hypothetical protein
MKNPLLSLLCGACICALVSPAGAALFQYQLDFEYSGGAEPIGPKPWLVATFEDAGIDGPYNVVKLTMDGGGLSGNEFVSSWFFNTVFSNLIYFEYQLVPSTGPASPAITVKSNALDAGGAAGFDIEFDFPTANSPIGARFEADELVVYTIEGIGLSAADFNFMNSGGEGLYSAAHVQSIPADPGSGWIGSGASATPVPEPVTLLLFGIGLLGIGFWGRTNRG